MFIKKIVSLCEKTKICRMLNDGDIFWLGDGQAFYPLGEIPEFTEKQFCSVYDITDKKKGGIHFSFNEVIPEGFDFSDAVKDEIQCELIDNISINYGGKTLVPLKASEGLVYLNVLHFAPIADSRKVMRFIFERKSKDGILYFVVKVGLKVAAVLLPYNQLNRNFSDLLSEVAELTEVRVDKMEAVRNENT